MSETGKCISCGKETDRRVWGELNKNWAIAKGCWDEFRCQECVDAEALDDWQNEQAYTDEITCPWCEYEESDSWGSLNRDYDNEYKCPSCGRTFEVERNVEITYTSRKRECDYEGDE